MALAACAATPKPSGTGLFTSLPILWPEAESIGELLGPASPHWALEAIGRHGKVRPLDNLMPGSGAEALAGAALLVMAQPRPLSPRENVSLDRWVRRGGRLLLFADPMLTARSRFALGDRRRPEAIAMLSPILARWGLRLEFDDTQPAGEHQAEVLGAAIPVDLPGRFAALGRASRCTLLAGGLAARCGIGRGRVLAIADAALLGDAPAAETPARRDALARLIDSLR